MRTMRKEKMGDNAIRLQQSETLKNKQFLNRKRLQCLENEELQTLFY